jgi:hypothetical protein
MKRILIPTDFSEHSNNSIEYVLEYFKNTKIPCQILLLNTYMVQQTDPSKVILANDDLKKRSLMGLERQRSEALKKNDNPLISIETVSHMGSLNNVIQHLLQKEKIDLVAMDRDNGDRKNLKKVSDILEQRQCPLLITSLGTVS